MSYDHSKDAKIESLQAELNSCEEDRFWWKCRAESQQERIAELEAETAELIEEIEADRSIKADKDKRIAEYQQECKRLCFEVGFEKRRADQLRADVNNQAKSIEVYQEAEDIASQRIAELEAHIKTLFYYDENHVAIPAKPPKGGDHDQDH